MKMKDWINETYNLLKFRKKEVLKDSERISHRQALIAFYKNKKGNNKNEKHVK